MEFLTVSFDMTVTFEKRTKAIQLEKDEQFSNVEIFEVVGSKVL